MPYRRRQKRSYRPKRRFNRRRRRTFRRKRAPRMSYNKLGTISPDSLFVKLKYTESINKTGVGQTHILSMNSLFDPNTTGVGTQPLGFDQYAALYGHYQVMGCRLKVRAINNSTTVNSLIAMYPSTSLTGSLFAEASEQKYAKQRYLNNSQGGNNMAILSTYSSPKKMIGRVTDSVNYTAVTSANPANQVYWVISTAPVDNVSNNDIFLIINMTFYAKFWKRNQLTTS